MRQSTGSGEADAPDPHAEALDLPDALWHHN